MILFRTTESSNDGAMVSIRFLGKCAHKMMPQPVETRQTCVRDRALNCVDTAVDGAPGKGVLLWALRGVGCKAQLCTAHESLCEEREMSSLAVRVSHLLNHCDKILEGMT